MQLGQALDPQAAALSGVSLASVTQQLGQLNVVAALLLSLDRICGTFSSGSSSSITAGVSTSNGRISASGGARWALPGLASAPSVSRFLVSSTCPYCHLHLQGMCGHTRVACRRVSTCVSSRGASYARPGQPSQVLFHGFQPLMRGLPVPRDVITRFLAPSCSGAAEGGCASDCDLFGVQGLSKQHAVAMYRTPAYSAPFNFFVSVCNHRLSTRSDVQQAKHLQQCLQVRNRCPPCFHVARVPSDDMA